MNASLLSTLAIMGIGPQELLWVFLIILLLFGGAKLPSLARGLGQSIREFKKSSNEEPPPTAEAKKTETTKSHETN